MAPSTLNQRNVELFFAVNAGDVVAPVLEKIAVPPARASTRCGRQQYTVRVSRETRFVGSIPELYDRHLGPVLFEPYANDLSARLPAGARRVLEIAAGTGRLTRQLLGALPETAELIATDLNAPMIEIARARLSDPRLSWEVADAQALSFAPASFDVVACQFGLMFVPDKLQALLEMKRVLRPGGTLLLSTWDELVRNPASLLVHELAMTMFPADPPRFMTVPFSMDDAASLEQLARAAGFAQARVDTVAATARAASAADFAIGLVGGNPMWDQLIDRGLDAPAFRARVADALAQAYGHAPCRSSLSAHVLTARA